MLTADTISDDQIRALHNELLSIKRQNAYTRAIRKDWAAALKGSRTCRESCADAWNKRHAERPVVIELPREVVSAIEDYLNTDWSDGRDPSRLGAVNAVAFIGERVAAIYASRDDADQLSRVKP